MEISNCRNCNEPVTGNYCSNCGQPAKLKRIDKHYIIQEIGEFLFANKGMAYTIRKVLINPGDSVRRFIVEDRYRFVKPITFIFITSIIYALINHLFNIKAEDYYQQSDDIGPTTNLILKWMVIDYPGYAGIITGLFVAFWIKLFFRKAGYNIFEIFVLICFLSGITTLLMSVAVIIQGITHFEILQNSSFIITIYFIWAVGHFFDKKKAASYIKTLLSFLLGSTVMGIAIIVVGNLIDLIIK